MKQIIPKILIALVFFFLLGTKETLAITMGSSNFSIDGANFDAGGGNSASSNYSLSNTSGENYLSFSQSSNFINNPGLTVPSPTPTSTPASTSTSSSSSSSSSSTSSTTGAGTTSSCTAAKPASPPTLLSANAGGNSVTLTWSKAADPLTHYLVAYGTSPGSIQYGNPNVGGAGTTSYTVQGLSGGATYYFKIKAINNCMPGDFSNEVSATLGGGVITIGETPVETPAEGFVPASEIPSQLFDIALFIDRPLIQDSRKLAARVTFVSFGTEKTPVDMEFIVLDASGKELYKVNGKTEIQTEGLYNQNFLDLVIPDGKYTLLLKTLYADNVSDEFRQPFEVRNNVCSGLGCVSCAYIWWIIPLELIIIALLLWRRRHHRKEGGQHV